MNSRVSLCVFAVVFAAVLLGCATPDSRIKKDQVTFESFSPAAQAKIRAGQVDLGFTAPMVKIALGEPNRVYTRNSSKGVEEVWAYRDQGPAFSVGVGASGGGRSGGIGAGVGVQTGEGRGDRTRIVLQAGIVTAIETVRH